MMACLQRRFGVKRIASIFLTLTIVFMLTACGSNGKSEVSFSDIENMAENAVFNVDWTTMEGNYKAGTSYIIDSDKFGEKLLVTAFHYLWPDNVEAFTGEQLPDFVKGGQLYYAKSEKISRARLKQNLVTPDADAVPNIAKDVAAFTLTGADGLMTLTLSDRKPKAGESIYLLARLWDGDVLNENCVYECKVESCDDDQIVYTLDSKYGSTMGASGGPLVDKYGEVVGMHMAGNVLFYYGHTAESFRKQIENGHLSDVTYP